MTVEEYNARVFQKARDVGLTVKQIAHFYQTDEDKVETLTSPPNKLIKSKSVSIFDKIEFCTKQYGFGNWNFLTGEELMKLLMENNN